MQFDLSPVIQYILGKALIGMVVAGVGALLMSPFKKAKAEWKEFKESITTVKTELQQQRTNHLTHIEQSGNQQERLLEKAVETLEAIHLGQVEMSGYIKAGFLKK